MALSSRRAVHLLNSSRGISSTPHLASFGWFEKLKQHQLYARITGKKPHEWPSESFTLLKFADSMDKARKLGNFSSFMSGRPADSSTVGPAMEKHAAVLRYLATIDPHAEVVLIYPSFIQIIIIRAAPCAVGRLILRCAMLLSLRASFCLCALGSSCRALSLSMSAETDEQRQGQRQQALRLHHRRRGAHTRQVHLGQGGAEEDGEAPRRRQADAQVNERGIGCLCFL
ncbi:unnamed protein product [Alopecurus aequalis]